MSNIQNQLEQSFVPAVAVINNRPAVTSYDVAEHFGKKHFHVMRDIRKIMESIPEQLRESTFGLALRTVDGPNNSQRQEEYFILYQDGFMLLVMGYTGAKAMRIKIAYIIRFNEMTEELRKRWGTEPQKALSDSPLTPDQQATIKNMVKALVDKGGIYANIYSRFNNHFRLGSYKQLPQSKMGEAIAYLMGLDVGEKMLPEQPALPARQDLWKTLLPLFNQIHESIGQMEDAAYEILATMDNYTKGIVFHPRKLESVPHHLVINARESMVCTLNSLESTTRAFKNDVWMLESAAKHYWRTGNRIN